MPNRAFRNSNDVPLERLSVDKVSWGALLGFGPTIVPKVSEFHAVGNRPSL